VGAVADEAPAVGVADVQRGLLAEYAGRYRLDYSAVVDELALARAGELLDRHRVGS
jgi:hypothetical protein